MAGIEPALLPYEGRVTPGTPAKSSVFRHTSLFRDVSKMEPRVGIEPTCVRVASSCLTTWRPRHQYGGEPRSRTHTFYRAIPVFKAGSRPHSRDNPQNLFISLLQNGTPGRNRTHNRRPRKPWPPPVAGAQNGTDDWIRTSDIRLRRATLYPTELRRYMELPSGVEPDKLRVEASAPRPAVAANMVEPRGIQTPDVRRTVNPTEHSSALAP